MDGRRFFLSYSRQELYFAQAVAQAVQAAGLDLWFDLQQLEPGCTWKADIAAGLETSAELVLIVSRSALKSPWVAKEWQAALQTGKPIHLVFFEPVTFGMIRPETGQNFEPFDTTPVFDVAVSIIDARRDFNGAMSRLVAALRGEARPREVIPAPNLFRLPFKMPLAVGYVAGSLTFLTAFTLLISLVSLSAYLPLMVAGLLGTGIFAYQTWAFLRRESFFGARLSTLLGVILTLYFAFPLTPVFIVAVWLAFRSPDIHRWSPLGQGLSHGHDVLPTEKRRMSNRPGEGWVLVLIPFMALVVIEPLLFFPGLILTFITERRQRWGKLRRPLGKNEVSYRFNVTYDAPDQVLRDDIVREMEGAGHILALTKNAAPPDFEIFVASNQTSDSLLNRFTPAEGARIVVVLGSDLEDDRRFKAFGEYQWVDYRRRDPARLEAMAEDLRANSGNSYSTRTVPYDFRRILLPRPVAWYMAVQFVFFNLFFVGNTRTLLQGGRLNALDWFSLIYGLIGVFVTVWMMNRVMRREITIPRLVRLGLGLILAGSVIGLLLGLLMPIPRGMVRDTNAIGFFLIANLIGVIVGYLYGRFYLRTVLGHWLPVGYSNVAGGFPAFKRDAALWRRNALSAAFAIVLTMGFLGEETPVDIPDLAPNEVVYERVNVRTLSLDLPRHWISSEIEPRTTGPYRYNVPISAILRRTNGPLNEATGVLINRAFQGGLNDNVLTALGEQIEVIFNRIESTLTGEFDWNPDYYYGDALYSRVFTRDSRDSTTFVMTVWHFTPTPANTFAPGWSITTVNSLAGTLRSGSSRRSDMTYWETSRQTLENGLVVDEVTFSQRLETRETVFYRVFALDDRSSETDDYFIIFSGSQAAVTAQQPVIDSIIASSQVE